MARNQQTPAEKARAIATTATWLAGMVDRMGVDGYEPAEELVRAIDAAYQALQTVSEATARNQVCAMLWSMSRRIDAGDEFDRASLRRFIATLQTADEYRIDHAPIAASDEAIDAALTAWRRLPGEKKQRGEPDKWEATAALLRESGFGFVEPAALRKSWDRRNK